MKNRYSIGIATSLALALSCAFAATDVQAATCPDGGATVTANVVLLDTPIMFNRLGAQNVNWMTYALRRDVVEGTEGNGEPLTNGGDSVAGQVSVRADKRIRPLVLRVNEGECLEISFQNLLAGNANPFNADDPALQIDDQVTGRYAGFHVQGLQLVGSIASDASNVGKNHETTGAKGSLAAPGETKTYTYYAPPGTRGTYLAHSYGATWGGEASAGNTGVGAFAAVNVEPKGARWYRSQVTEEELRLATTGTTPLGQPILDYEAVYPNSSPWNAEGKGGLPVLNMRTAGNEIVHSDLNAVIAYKDADGFKNFPGDTYPLESVGKRNPTVPNRLEPFREFTVIFHDENAVAQAFPKWFLDPVLGHTLHGVRDTFLINYGSGGIGSEIIANRLGVGPMHDCLSCSYEEFFLTSFTVGDPAMLVNVPANAGLELCDPALNNCGAVGPKADFALYPDDPSNVHHSYISDRVVFRNLHAGKEQHVFHLHNHQWLFDANDDDSNYIDAQGVGAGSGYTYEINFGGSGNRNKSAGDAIFHCHFYPHFAQGMWEHWRNHDVFEAGTPLEVSGGSEGFHSTPFHLHNGTPAAHPQAGVDGIPSGARMRALPDGEILAGTPIPAIVPLPGQPMAVMPGEVVVVTKDSNGIGGPDSSQAHVVDRTKNPGYPFWIAGIDCGPEFAETGVCSQGIVGQRPPTPPLDMDVAAGGWDGGLPRHSLDGFLAVGGRIDNGDNPAAGGVFHQVQTRLSMEKEIFKAKAVFFPEEGTDLEQVAMAFHGKNPPGSGASPVHIDTHLPDGNPATGTAGFRVNGAPPQPGAPFFEPCIDDTGAVMNGQLGNFFSGDSLTGMNTTGKSPYTADNPRVYKGAAIQIDAIFNKAGYHYPQQRITALWDDVVPTITKEKAPYPFVIRNNTFDCTRYIHTNLVPKFFELDDYQIKTPTDIIGQHIHLPKWDLPSADGSGNGWNYEDGTLSPGMVQERIFAINNYNPSGAGNPPDSANRAADTPLVARPHPVFGSGQLIPDGPLGSIHEYVGARNTIQRWFFDPVVNVAGVDRGLGIIFTHDHYGPSTHQQIGLYASVLTEPAGSLWAHNETGEEMYSRHDGGPTDWQAVIKPGATGYAGTAVDPNFEPFREFWFQYGDFQHAYEAGVYVGAGPDGRPDRVNYPVKPTTFVNAINPSYRQFAEFPDIMKFPPFCPGTLQNEDGTVNASGIVPRPCPEAITADDSGMLVVNYRNEPIGLRVYDPNKDGPDGKKGTQSAGDAGDLAFALQSRTDRAIAAFNTQPGFYKEEINVRGALKPGDPFTPMMRAYYGDQIRVKTQAGSTEHEHNWTIHGQKWLQGGSGHGMAKNSGWRNAQNGGISEQFTFTASVLPQMNGGAQADYAYSADASQDGWWTGMWGILRTYGKAQKNLVALPNNKVFPLTVVNSTDFTPLPGQPRTCPTNAPLRSYDITAVLANMYLDNPLGVTIPSNANRDSDGDGTGDNEGAELDTAGGTLVYNPRFTNLTNGKSGPLHDPTAILYVMTEDLEADRNDDGCYRLVGRGRNQNRVFDPTLPTCPVRLKADAPVEPIVLRAAAGDCIDLTLRNRLPAILPDLAGVNTLLQVVNRDRDAVKGMTTFQNNLIRPSSYVGLHTQLLAYDVTKDDGVVVGGNGLGDIVPPGESRKYTWYAGHLSMELEGGGKIRVTPTPVEFGGVNLQPADKIKQGQKGLVGALAVHPEGSTWTNDPGTRAAATVNPGAAPNPQFEPFKDFSVVVQKALNHRYGDGTHVENIASEGQGIPEDSHDAGQMAVNYRSEPMWFRFGIRPDAPFGHAPLFPGGGFADVPNPEDAYSNSLAGVGGDPVTPVFTASAGQPARFHVLEPTGAGRGTTFHLHGHLWQRAPYVCPDSADLGLVGKCAAGDVGSQAIGVNPIGMYLGAQESVTPSAHFDIVLPGDGIAHGGAGGVDKVKGDYLYRDQGSFGNTGGIWGILRVE